MVEVRQSIERVLFKNSKNCSRIALHKINYSGKLSIISYISNEKKNKSIINHAQYDVKRLPGLIGEV